MGHGLYGVMPLPVELVSASPGCAASHVLLDGPKHPFPHLANTLSPSW